jgi:MSHA pilin protein MshC
VLLIVGIIAAVGAPRFFQLNDFNDLALREEIAAALRYAQKLSIASQCGVEVRVNAGGLIYGLRMRDDDGSTPVTCDPTDSFTYRVLRPDASPSGPDPYYERSDAGGSAVGGSLSIVFDALGRPSSAASVSVGGKTIGVEAETGLVSVQ